MAPSTDSVNITSSAVPVYETKPGSIIVPGLSGTTETAPVFICQPLTRRSCPHPRLWMEDATCARRFGFYRRSTCVLLYYATPLIKCSDVLSRIKAYLRSHPEVAGDPTAFIQGMGWDQNRWASKHFPTAVGFRLAR